MSRIVVWTILLGAFVACSSVPEVVFSDDAGVDGAPREAGTSGTGTSGTSGTTSGTSGTSGTGSKCKSANASCDVDEDCCSGTCEREGSSSRKKCN